MPRQPAAPNPPRSAPPYRGAPARQGTTARPGGTQSGPVQPGPVQFVAGPPPAPPQEKGWLGQQLPPDGRARVGWLILPLRIFFGITFLYAGLDKLLDPTFLDPNAPGSIVAQMHAFALHSPLAPLVTAIGIPFAVPLGLLIAIGEIGVGLGALTGIGFRLAAVGGFLISTLFWLTASWTDTPYFYGPDLPYAFGWLTLALVGDCGVLTLAPRLERAWVAMLAPVGYPERQRNPRHPSVTSYPRGSEPSLSPGRRALLQAGMLAIVAFVLGGITRFVAPAASASPIAGGVGALPTTLPTDAPTQPGSVTTPSETPFVDTTAGPADTPAPPQATPNGTVVAKVSEVKSQTAVEFTDPTSGDPAVVIALKNGSFVAFDEVCTHAGCTVQYVKQYDALLCPCHGAAFDPNNHGAVLQARRARRWPSCRSR